MVQMKAFGIFSTSISLTPFISHMVQMKGDGRCLKSPRYGYLYIPHGSDESLKDVFVFEKLMFLYIPHGSDESREAL